MDNQLDKEITQLQQQLSEAIVARGGLEDSFGKLLIELYGKHITRLTRDVTSDKYRKDLAGYNIALSDLLAYKTILKELQIAGSPIRETKLREKLDELEEDDNV